MRKTLIVLAALASTPALAEMDRGGNVAWYADQVMRWHGPKRIGWYYSAAAMWLGNPGSCVDSGSMVHLHPVVDTAKAAQANIPSVWNGIIDPNTPFYTARDVQTVRGKGKTKTRAVNWSYSYASVMSHTPWGRNVFQAAYARGCFADPNGCNFYARDLISLGVPVCYGGGQ